MTQQRLAPWLTGVRLRIKYKQRISRDLAVLYIISRGQLRQENFSWSNFILFCRILRLRLS